MTLISLMSSRKEKRKRIKAALDTVEDLGNLEPAKALEDLYTVITARRSHLKRKVASLLSGGRKKRARVSARPKPLTMPRGKARYKRKRRTKKSRKKKRGSKRVSNVWRSSTGNPFPTKAMILHRDIKQFDVDPGAGGALAVHKFRLNDLKNYSEDGVTAGYAASDIHAVEQLSTHYQQSSVLETTLTLKVVTSSYTGTE